MYFRDFHINCFVFISTHCSSSLSREYSLHCWNFFSRGFASGSPTRPYSERFQVSERETCHKVKRVPMMAVIDRYRYRISVIHTYIPLWFYQNHQECVCVYICRDRATWKSLINYNTQFSFIISVFQIQIKFNMLTKLWKTHSIKYFSLLCNAVLWVSN